LSKKKRAPARRIERLVIDSSVAIAWCFPDKRDDYSQSVLSALTSQRAVVPDLWHLEIANTLLVGERRNRSTQANTVKWLGFLAALPIAVDEETKLRAFTHTVSVARERNLSAYDAAYLELAIRRDLPLATLDDKLKAAALAVGTPLFRLH
jgi:predicted nucleic acid-binding protein